MLTNTNGKHCCDSQSCPIFSIYSFRKSLFELNGVFKNLSIFWFDIGQLKLYVDPTLKNNCPKYALINFDPILKNICPRKCTKFINAYFVPYFGHFFLSVWSTGSCSLTFMIRSSNLSPNFQHYLVKESLPKQLLFWGVFNSQHIFGFAVPLEYT